MNIKYLLITLVLIIINIIALLFSGLGLIGYSLFFSIITAILMLLFIKKICKGFSNITVIFYAFSILYGLSGPISVHWGNGLPSIFGISYDIGAFLSGYILSNIGFLSGIIIYNLIKKNNSKDELYLSQCVYNNKDRLLNIAVKLAFVSMVFEIINFLRVGGFLSIIKGKAFYQSAISELTLTLPSGFFVEITFALLAINIGISLKYKIKINMTNIIWILIFMIPYFMVNIFLGKRGTLLSIAIVVFLGITFFKPLNKVKPKLIISVLVLYIMLGFLFANRGIASLIFTDTNAFVEKAFDRKRLVDALKPGSNEFGTPFGNFNMFYLNSNEQRKYLLGESYVKGLVVFIPSFAYPGEKPQQIGYKFRDMYFPTEAMRGSIAGTAFSSILEAYWNFGYLGVFLIYFILGMIIQYMDCKIRYNNVYFAIFYISIAPFAISFHRSSFGNIFATIVLKAIIIFVLFKLMSTLMTRRYNTYTKINTRKSIEI